MPSDRSVIAYRPDAGMRKKLEALQDETGLPMAQIVNLAMRAYIIKQEKDRQRLEHVERQMDTLLGGALNAKTDPPPHPSGEQTAPPPSSAGKGTAAPDHNRDDAHSKSETPPGYEENNTGQGAGQLVGSKQ